MSETAEGGTPSAGEPRPASADEVRELYDQAPFGYVSTDTDWTIFRANRTFLDLVGRSSDEVVGRRLPELLAPGDRIFHETHYAPLLRLQGSVRGVAADIVGADGSLHPVLLRSDLVVDERSGATHIRTGVVEVSERRRYEDELRRQRHRAEASEARERMRREALQDLASAVTTDDVAAALVDTAARVVGGGAARVWLLSPDGRTLAPGGRPSDSPAPDVDGPGIEARALRDAEVTEDAEGRSLAIPLHAGSRPLGVLVVERTGATRPDEHEADLLLDIGQQAGQALERAQLYEDKDRMLGMVAHDLRTPLATIGGFAQTLQRVLDDDLAPAAAQSLERIVVTTQRLTRLTDDLLDAAVLRLGEFTLDRVVTPVGQLVVQAAAAHQHVAEEKAIPLDLHDDSSGARAAVDPDRLIQVVDNLVSNALKYSPPQRPVTVSVAATPDRIRVEVADRGPGIPPDELAGLFSAFGRTSNRPTGGESSTGLGLAIARGIVEAHGGALDVESEQGEGSTFAFWVPRDTGDEGVPDS